MVMIIVYGAMLKMLNIDYDVNHNRIPESTLPKATLTKQKPNITIKQYQNYIAIA